MYYFEAHYINMDTDEDVTRDVVFDGQFFENDRDCYIYAMCRAYDMCESNELFVGVEIIAC